jgi:hypothetical protein
MQEREKPEDLEEGSPGRGNDNGTRPQQAGEGATTRFGMEEGDNMDVPATGGVSTGDEARERSA